MPLDQAGSNTASNDAFVDWARQVRKQKRICEEEHGVLRSLIKRAKADGVNTKAMLDAIKATKLDPEVVAADLRDQLRYMALIRIPMTQASLFDWDVEVTQKTEHEDDLWDAEDKGYKAGRHGVRLEDCPYEGGSEQHVHWTAWWHKGQAAIARELGPDVTQANSSRTRPARGATQPRLGAISGDSAKAPRAPRRKRAAANPSAVH